MRRNIEYVTYPWWPVDGDAWIHPEDVAVARRMIPSSRMFRYRGQHGPFTHLTYGDCDLRVRPAMWLPRRGEGFDVGDEVEIRSRLGRRRAGVATIREMLWNPYRGCVEYQLERRGMPLAESFLADDFRAIEPPMRPGQEVALPAGPEGEPLQLRTAE